ncbi:catalase family protein [Novosphingobium sp. AP12]|uniref:catalase family protein n=1 Tax=Novosphingobium sp. AP12 TaxID=1144305 RepID=UPI000271F5DB|nr:catalase family protein [Novosphingobium sp. AP12]EJL34175.1 Catalase [Novosphingobium sp. AP12]
MTDYATATPIRYQPSVEKSEADEAETIKGLSEQLHGIQETTLKDFGHAIRAVHAKGHAIVRGRLTVLDGLPVHLAQGVFAAPGAYDAILRFSTLPGDILDDSVSVPRGLALKILDVAGDRLPGSEAASSQDFVLVNGPAFASATPKAFLANLKMLASTTDKAEGLKKAFSATLQAVDAVLETVGIASPTVQTLGGAPNTHPLGETYYTQTPFRYGDYIAKINVAPVSPNLTALTGDKVETSDRPDALREIIRETMIEAGGEWELRVQLCTDLDTMPIEDASKVWDEKASPYVVVARIRVEPQISWEHGTSDHLEDGLSFGPWHGITAHQPLGGVNRARNSTYAKSADFRGQRNGCPIREPKSLAELEG